MNITRIGIMVGSTSVELTTHWVQGAKLQEFIKTKNIL